MGQRNMTIGQIAQLCGVSKGTVSRALTRPDMLKPETLERIRQVMREHNYMPNPVARAMNYERSKTISIVVPDINFSFQSELMKSAQQALHWRNYNLLVLDSSVYQSRTVDYNHMLKRQITLGTIFCYENDLDSIQSLAMLQPVVSFELEGEGISSLVTDVKEGVCLMMRHLVAENGHQRIALVMGRESDDYTKRTIDAFCACQKSYGLEEQKDYIVCSAWSKQAGKEAMARLLKLPSPPTAVIYFSCTMAQGGLLECFEQGISVPSQMSIATLDGAEENGFLIPPLTTVDLSVAEIGRELADMMLAMIEGGAVPLPAKLVKPTGIRIGKSVTMREGEEP